MTWNDVCLMLDNKILTALWLLGKELLDETNAFQIFFAAFDNQFTFSTIAYNYLEVIFIILVNYLKYW